MRTDEIEVFQRLKDDFGHYAARCLKIRTKDGGVEPLVLNQAQRYIHARLEHQRAETGRIRALLLKGRQQGASTYVEARFYWKTTHAKGQRAFILTHQDEATKNLFEMAGRFHEHCPPEVRPTTSASNARELVFDRLDSGYRVGTAGSKGAGRSATFQRFHGSEVAYWPNAESHVAGALQAVPGADGTEIILESTSDGPQGVFYEMCMAAQRGDGDYLLIFVPWFWQDEYRRTVAPGFTLDDEERAYAAKHGLDLEQMAWRRIKIQELASANSSRLSGRDKFRREYPADVEEAFAPETKGTLFNRAWFEVVDAAPAGEAFVRYWDKAGTEGAGCNTAGALITRGANGVFYVENMIKGQWGAMQREQVIKQTATSDREAHGAAVMIWVEQEPGSGGKESAESTIRNLAGFVVRSDRVTGDKVTRARPMAAQAEAGNVKLVRGSWNADFLDELVAFPGGGLKDQVDAAAGAFNKLTAGAARKIPTDLPGMDFGHQTSGWMDLGDMSSGWHAMR